MEQTAACASSALKPENCQSSRLQQITGQGARALCVHVVCLSVCMRVSCHTVYFSDTRGRCVVISRPARRFAADKLEWNGSLSVAGASSGRALRPPQVSPLLAAVRCSLTFHLGLSPLCVIHGKIVHVIHIPSMRQINPLILCGCRPPRPSAPPPLPHHNTVFIKRLRSGAGRAEQDPTI